MYESHFDLKILPFKMTPDPAFICWNSQHRRAADTLELGFSRLAPLAVLTGDVGSGKTTLLLHFLNKKPEGLTTGLISSFSSGLDSLYCWVLNAFDLRPKEDEIECFEAFQQFVLSEYAAGKRCLLVVDEAQNLSDEDLERLRMLTNINSGKDVLLMIFLVGQPQLRERLSIPANRQIAQRIGASFNLGPMDLSDTRNYVRHRISIAGGDDEIFDDDAIRIIHHKTGGVPRLVNLVCEMALVSAFGEGIKRIDGATMQTYMDGAERYGMLACLPDPASSSDKLDRPNVTPIETDFVSNEVTDLGSPPIRLKFVDKTIEPAQNELDVEKLPQEPAPETTAPKQLVPQSNTETKDLQVVNRPQRVKSRAKIMLLTGTAVALVAFFAATSVTHYDPQQIEQDSITVLQSSKIDPPPPQNNLLALLPETIVPFENISSAALLDSAIETGVTNPAAAAIAYARAALLGEQKAAYSLGQLYETGHGVPLDLARARSWYTMAQDSERGARRRLANLGVPDQTGEMAAPLLLLGGPVTGGGAQFVWTPGDGADPEFFVVELSSGPQGPVTRLPPTDQSALRAATIEEARIWRALAVDAERGLYTVSEWMPLGDQSEPTLLGTTPVETDVIVTAPKDLDPKIIASVTQPLAAANLSYRMIESPVETESIPQVLYHFEKDKFPAQQIAAVLGESAKAMLLAPGDTSLSQPLPGQITIIPAVR